MMFCAEKISTVIAHCVNKAAISHLVFWAPLVLENRDCGCFRIKGTMLSHRRKRGIKNGLVLFSQHFYFG